MTATTRVGVHRYTFPETDPAHLVMVLRSNIYNYDKPILIFFHFCFSFEEAQAVHGHGFDDVLVGIDRHGSQLVDAFADGVGKTLAVEGLS